jgi:hypothetical protein
LTLKQETSPQLWWIDPYMELSCQAAASVRRGASPAPLGQCHAACASLGPTGQGQVRFHQAINKSLVLYSQT